MIALLALLLAAPPWAQKPDATDAGGTTFVCEGRGKAEDDALAAAQGICNDKICKVCGVEVESITETKETLQGIDFQRKVVERCRRVRSGETKVQFKSTDCGPDGCAAWLQIRYTNEDRARECPAYAREDFSDPAACEQDIDQFSKLEGRAAADFYKRTALLDAALGHCDKIDVRPTPAILALVEKLSHGLDAFEYVPREVRDGWGDSDRRPLWGWYLARFEPLRKQLSETKLLIDRLKLARDYVHDKALAFDVIEAVTDDAWDTPAGLSRMLAAMEKAPPGKHYGAPKVHFVGLFNLERAKSDTAAIGALVRRLYPPESLDGQDAWVLALYFKGDGRVTQEEWDYSMAAHRLRACESCLRVLLEAKDHGGDEVRAARFSAAWKSLPDKTLSNPKRAFSAYKSLIGYSTPALFLLTEPLVPAEVRALFDWDLYEQLITRFYDHKPKDGRRGVLERAARALADGPLDHSSCSSLAARLKRVTDAGGDVAPVHGRVCACLRGPLGKETSGYVNKSDLNDLALQHKLACAAAARE